MQKYGVNELREMFLKFFEGKNHSRLSSASLVPSDDNSLLLINSGMAPLKKYFTGEAVPPNTKVTTCQKCIRTPDIERVGKTSRHGTYFEMLGNFSFGDYFKDEAIKWAWEFFTGILKLPEEKLYVSVYEEDDEAYQIWTEKIGISPNHMVRLGKADNFWEHGSGPCGPCSEIYFDRGESKGCGGGDCRPGCDCDRYVEVWNLVFTQFVSDGKGNYTPMKNPNIDTGMGLERLACVIQEVDNLFEVDTVQSIMGRISDIAGIQYRQNEKNDVSLRVITDHIRSITFMVGDGILPSNEGRGYVLRRLLRRAARHGKMLGISEPFLYKACETVINENCAAYSQLSEKREYIKKIIKIEEENFARTIDKGMELLSQVIEKLLRSGGNRVISGEDAFKLSDTFGFPLDLTVEIAAEKGISVDEACFNEIAQRHKEKARADRNLKSGSSWKAGAGMKLNYTSTVFTGYEKMEDTAKVIAISKGGALTDNIEAGMEGVIILDKTPFYAESGGQAGDTGKINGNGIFEVSDTKKDENGVVLHTGVMASGKISVGDTVNAVINESKRLAAMRNHTAAHLLQAALREILGEHVHQAGQLVDDEKCRFDFSHFSAMTSEEIQKVEETVNEKILAAIQVESNEMGIDQAKRQGAMALFGEKYGETVRVVSISDYSKEFCGGTHIENTARLGLFKIISESSVAAGIRRIEAVTGMGVLGLLNDYKQIIFKSASALKLANMNELDGRCLSLMSELKDKEKQIEKLSSKSAEKQLKEILGNAKEINGTKVISVSLKGVEMPVLRQLGDKIKDETNDVAALLASVSCGKGSLYCVCGKAAVAKGANAGEIVRKAAALTGGKGGGRPDSAMAGVGDVHKLDEALNAFEDILGNMIK